MIVLVSAIDVVITTRVMEKPNSVPFSEFKIWWIVDLLMFLIKAILHMYSIFLILKATRIMKRIAKQKGHSESTKDIEYMTIVGIFCFLAFFIEIVAFAILSILQITKAIDYKTI